MIEHLNEESFRKKVFDYTNDKDFKYLGTLPAVIDFYADWCGPCKMVSPILEDLAKEYEDKIVIYKINTEKEEKLSAMFAIRSIPTFLFIPLSGEPRMGRGAMTKQQFEQIFADIFSVIVPHKDEEEDEKVPDVDNFVDDFQDTSDVNVNSEENKDDNSNNVVTNEEMTPEEKEKMTKENFLKGDAE